MGALDQNRAYFPYINIVRSCYTDYGPGGIGVTLDVNEDLATVNNGETVTCAVWNSLSEGSHAIKTGQYVIKWDGIDAPLTILCAGSTGATKTGTRRYVVTVPQVSSTNASEFRFFWLNNTGSNVFPITNFRVCHADHEAAMDAGQIFNQDWVAAVGVDRLRHIRTMDPMQINGSTVSTAAACRLESSRSWTSYGTDKTGMPYTVAAKLAVKLGCNLHAPTPIRVSSQVELNAIAAQIFSVAAFRDSTLKIDAEVGNENWNNSFPARTWLNYSYGPTQSPSLNAPQAEAQIALKWFKALENAGFERSRINRLYCGQVGNIGAVGSQSYFDLAMQYVDTANILGAGGSTKFYQLIDEVRVAPYTHLSADGVTEMYHSLITNVDWVNKSDAQIDTYFANGLIIVNARLATLYSYISNCRPSLKLGSYEWGQELSKTISGFSSQGYEFTINATNNTAVWTSGFPASFTNGDAWRFYYQFAQVGYVNDTLYYIKAKTASEAWFFPNEAARLADTGNTGAGAVNLNASGGPFVADNFTRTVQFKDRLRTYLDSDAGRVMYQNYFAATVGAGKLQMATQYFDFCGYGDEPYVTFWGLKKSVYSPNTPRSSWFLSQ